MAVTNIYEVVVKGNQSGQQYRNVIHFYDEIVRNDEFDPSPRLLEFAQAVLECFITNIIPIVTNDVRITGCAIKTIWPAVGLEVEASPEGDDGVGTAAGDWRATFESMVVTKKANVGGRHGKGRIKLPAPPEGASTTDFLTAPQLAALANFALCLAGKFIGPDRTTDYQLALLQRQHLNVETLLGAAAVRPVIHLTIEDLIGSQRTRKVGVGK